MRNCQLWQGLLEAHCEQVLSNIFLMYLRVCCSTLRSYGVLPMHFRPDVPLVLGPCIALPMPQSLDVSALSVSASKLKLCRLP